MYNIFNAAVTVYLYNLTVITVYVDIATFRNAQSIVHH